MPEVPSSLKVKNFGKDETFSSVRELKAALSKNYRDMHVTIVYPTKPNGLLRTVFVSVNNTGEIRETYGDKDTVDFDLISEALL